MKKNTTMNKWTGGSLLAGLTLISVPALAQDVENLNNGVTAAPAEAGQTDTNNMPVSVSAGLSQQFNADIDKNNGGKFSVSRFNAGAIVPFRLNDDWKLSVGARYQLDSYQFDVPNSASPGRIPVTWDHINTYTISSILGWRASDNWSYYGGGIVKMSAESGASLGQGTTGGGLLGFNYKFDDTLTLGAGLGVMSQIEENARVLPLITAKWKFADNWLLTAGLTDVATTGYGAEVKWLFSQEWDFGLGLQAHRSRFRIDGAPAGPLKDGIGQESSSLIYLDGTWHPNDKLDITGFFGVACGGKLRVDNSSGDKQFESDYKSAGVLGVEATLRF
jgi:hypothetical protein